MIRRRFAVVALFVIALPLAAAPAGAAPVCLGRCTGDCDANGAVAVNELLTLVNITLGQQPVESCPNLDAIGIDDLDIGDLVIAVRHALDGCPLRPNSDVCGCAPLRRPLVSYGSSSVTTNVSLEDNATATSDVNDPPSSCGCANNAHTQWFRVEPERDGRAMLGVRGSATDAVLSVFAGTCGTPLEQACARAPSRVAFPVRAGETYLVQVASACGADGGPFSLLYDLCGDGFKSVDEECDDGNVVDDDGCSAECTDDALGGFDQSWIGPDDVSCGVSAGDVSVGIPANGQVFIPTRPDLAAVEVLLSTQRLPSQNPETLAVSVHQTSSTGATIGRTTATLSGARDTTPFWQRFVFTPPLTVEPAATYVIVVETRRQGVFWFYSDESAQCSRPEPGYPGNPSALDFFFHTYGARDAALR
jgi:cysteine-rich repeat protein